MLDLQRILNGVHFFDALLRVIFVWLLTVTRFVCASALHAIHDKIPFSFIYDGKFSTEFLSKRNADFAGKSIICTDPATGLQITCEPKWTDNRAIDWVIHFKNTGRHDTPIIEHILPLDLTLSIAADDQPILYYSKGSTVGPSRCICAPARSRPLFACIPAKKFAQGGSPCCSGIATLALPGATRAASCSSIIIFSGVMARSLRHWFQC